MLTRPHPPSPQAAVVTGGMELALLLFLLFLSQVRTFWELVCHTNLFICLSFAIASYTMSFT